MRGITSEHGLRTSKARWEAGACRVLFGAVTSVYSGAHASSSCVITNAFISILFTLRTCLESTPRFFAEYSCVTIRPANQSTQNSSFHVSQVEGRFPNSSRYIVHVVKGVPYQAVSHDKPHPLEGLTARFLSRRFLQSGSTLTLLPLRRPGQVIC